MEFETTSESRPGRWPAANALSARRIAVGAAILVVCAIAVLALLQVKKAWDLRSRDQLPAAATADSDAFKPTESPLLRQQRLQRVMQSDGDPLSGATTEDLVDSTLVGLGLQPADTSKYVHRYQDRDSQASVRAERMAVRNIKALRATLEETGLDIDEVYRVAAAHLDINDAPPLMADSDFRAANAAYLSAEGRLYTMFADLKRYAILSYGATILPLGVPINAAGARFSSPYGMRTHPITGASKMHAGADFAAPTGAPVLATAEGEVVFAGVKGGYGNTIQIRHEFGLETTYAHLKGIRVEKGDRVEFNMWIGDMGSTGQSTGSHLHYEIRLNGQHLDPIIYILAGRDVYQE